MKRSGFKPRRPEPRPCKTYEVFTPRPRPVAVARADAPARLCAPMPKPEAARPGKRTPTADERRWMDAITAYGCIACRMDGLGVVPPAVHHILRGGRRIGHRFTLPLCDPGHHQNGGERGMVSRHPWKSRFEERYGAELHLLAALQDELGFEGAYA